MRYPALLLALLCALWPRPGRAQDTPPARTICEMPRSTPYWDNYCGGGGRAAPVERRNNCDAACQQEWEDEQARQQEIRDEADRLRRMRKEEAERTKQENKRIEKANALAERAKKAAQKEKWDDALNLWDQALATYAWDPWRIEYARATIKLGNDAVGLEMLKELMARLSLGTPPPEDDRARTIFQAELLTEETLKAQGRRCAQPNCLTGPADDPMIQGKTYRIYTQGAFKLVTPDGHTYTQNNTGQAWGVSLEGAHVTTEPNSKFSIVLPAGDLFTVGPNSDFIITGDPWIFGEKGDSLSHVVLVLNPGKYRWITGENHKKIFDKPCKEYPIPSGARAECNAVIGSVGTIGVRGTDYEVTVGAQKVTTIREFTGQTVFTSEQTGQSVVIDAGQKVTVIPGESKPSILGPFAFNPSEDSQ